MEELQTRLMEEQRRTQELEETLTRHVQQSSSQINMKQVNYFFIHLNFCKHQSIFRLLCKRPHWNFAKNV